MMQIWVNDERVEARPGVTVEELLSELDADFSEKSLIVSKEETKIRAARRYVILTTRGKLALDINESSTQFFASNYSKLSAVPVAWANPDMVAFGPVDLSSEGLRCSSSKVRREKNSLFINSSDNEGENAYICISLSPREEIAIIPENIENGILGRITLGEHLIRNLEEGDILKEVMIDYKAEKTLKRVTPNSPVTEGMRLYYKMLLSLSSEAPRSVEFLLAYLRNNKGVLTVSEDTSSYLRSENPITFDPPIENNKYFRERGDIMLRNVGGRKNSLYIYKEYRMPQSNLNNIGQVTGGIELADICQEGDRITADAEPPQIFVYGMTQSDAEGHLDSLNISHNRAGSTGDSDIIVAQDPPSTMEVYARGAITTVGIPPDKLLHVEFFDDEAPLTAKYVRDTSGVFWSYPIGRLDMVAMAGNLFVFSGMGKREAILHENTPEDVEFVESGMIGVTNISRPQYGLVGVRLERSETFGPTGEHFESTNIVGKIMKNSESLLDMGGGKKIVYFKDITVKSGE